MDADWYSPVAFREVLGRRLPPVLAVFAGACVGTLLLTFGLPSVYKSRAVILIEQQEIPQDLVRSLMTSFADQRIQTIAQRVLTNSNLAQIIAEHDLYVDHRRIKPLEVVLLEMRDDINVETISADVVDPHSGRPTQATIAFEVGYENRSPQLAQSVANQLTSLFLNENLKQRTQIAEQTLSFLSTESAKLGVQVTALENQLADFKETNLDNLPELNDLNVQLMHRTEGELDTLDARLSALQQQKVYLESELAQQSPTTRLFSETGERILGPADRLKVIESQYLLLTARYGPAHPDVVAARREVEALRAETGRTSSASEIEVRLQGLRAALAAAHEQYGAEHPDVRRLEREIDALNRELPAARTAAAAPAAAERPDNPAYIELQARLEATDTELAGLAAQRAELQRRLTDYEGRLTRTPRVEREYRTLTRDYENALAKYQEVQAKKLEAELSRNLETEQRGERFTLIEPPVLPEKAHKPNRLAIGLLGALLSMIGGVGSGVLVEALDSRVYGRAGVTKLLGVPPLAVIPVIDAPASRARRSRTRFAVTTGALLLVAVLAWLAHLYVKPLDVALFQALRIMGF